MIGAWSVIIIGAVVVVAGVVVLATNGRRDRYDRSLYMWGGIAAILVGLVASSASAFWLYGTEAGARAQKSFQSSTGGGLTRVVTVYDMEGDQIAQYEGKFDVDANAERIIFDVPQPDGSYKRHQIWSTTGTVTIVEK